MSVEAFVQVELEVSTDATWDEIREALYKVAVRLNVPVTGGWGGVRIYVQPSGRAVASGPSEKKRAYRRIDLGYKVGWSPLAQEEVSE